MSLNQRYGPWAVIAGASEGTGRAFARKLAREGVPSVLIARREAPLQALAEEIRAESGLECVTATIDLTAPDAAERMAAAASGREIGLFIVNAGADPYGYQFLETDLADWNDLVQRNVVTTMRSTYYFAKDMRARRKGGIILVNSGACYGGLPSVAAYSASKAFMLNLAEGLWSELRPDGVDVLTLVLGRTDTPEFRRLLAEKGLPVPADLASPDAGAATGLASPPHGPIQNWGLDDDVAGYTPQSAAARRARIVALETIMKESTGGGKKS